MAEGIKKKRGPKLSASHVTVGKVAYKGYSPVDAVNIKTLVDLHRTQSLSSYIYGEGETAAGFKCRGHRAGKSVIDAGNVLLFDIDSKEVPVTLAQLRDKFAGYTAAITPSRGSSEEVKKFHIVVQLDETLPMSAAAFKRIYRAAAQWFQLEGLYDPCMETWTQQLSPYMGNKGETWSNEGDLLCVEEILAAYVEPDDVHGSVRGFSGQFIPADTVFNLSDGGTEMSLSEMQERVLREGRQRVHCIDGLKHDGRWDTAFVDVNDSGSIYYYCSGGRCGVTHWLIDDGFEAEEVEEDPEPESIGYEETFLGDDSLPYRFIVEGLLPASSFGVAGAGGALKTTAMLSLMLHIVTGRNFAGRVVNFPGGCLMVTAEDELPIVRHRVRKLAEGMGLTDAEKRLVGKRLFIEDVSSKVARIVEADKAGNLRFTGYLKKLLKKYKSVDMSLVVFDPMVYFGAGERYINDNEGLLMAAARKFSEQFGCAAGFVHHTGKQAARDGTTDAYAGRGGSAFADNSRAMWVMTTAIDPKKPPSDDLMESCESLSRVVIAKQSYAKREEAPLYIGRELDNPWKLLFGWGAVPEDQEGAEQADEALFREAAMVAVYRAVKKLHSGGMFPNKTLLREWPMFVDGSRVAQKRILAAIEVAVQKGHIQVDEIPEHLRHGQAKYYYTPGMAPAWQDENGMIEVKDLE